MSKWHGLDPMVYILVGSLVTAVVIIGLIIWSA